MKLNHAGALIIIASIWSLSVIVLLTSIDDHNGHCIQPEWIPKFRPFNVGVNRTYDWIHHTKHHFAPCPSNYTLTCPEQTSSHQKKTTALLWAWLMFLEDDISQPIWTFDPCNKTQFRNGATPYIDASSIYGTNISELSLQRRHDGTGKLILYESPWTNPNDDMFFLNFTSPFHPLVLALKLLFAREHNYWCDRISFDFEDLNDGEIFQRARHLVAAEIQAITYQEVLPLLTGVQTLNSVNCFTWSENKKWEFSIQGEMALLFDMWETFAPSLIPLRDIHTNVPTNISTDQVDIEWFWKNGIESVLFGASRTVMPIFGSSGNNASLLQDKILRARSLGLASYRQYVVDFYSQRSEECLGELQAGLLSENGFVHHLTKEILSKQFAQMKHNDFYFYLWDRLIGKYREPLHNTKLSHIILRHTGISRQSLHPNVFELK